MRWTTRLSTLGAQMMWLLALGGMLGALAVVPKIWMDPPKLTMWNRAVVVSAGDETIVYEFTLDGKTYRGVDKYYGSSGPTGLVDIWYDPKRPEYSTTLSGKGQIGYGPGSLAVLIAPLVPFLCALLMMWRRSRFRMLRWGRIVDGTVTRVEETAGGRLRYVTLRYEMGELTVVRREPVGEPLVYDPSNPDHAIALADLTCAPTLDGDRWVPARIPYAVFFLPVVTLTLVVTLLAKSL